MHYRSFATLTSSAVIGLASLGGAPTLQAQARFAPQSSPPGLSPTSLLSALSRYRTVRWATAAHVIHCGPAPLTERPGIPAEYARPHIVPLEEAFADAQSVKRAVAYQSGTLAMENR